MCSTFDVRRSARSFGRPHYRCRSDATDTVGRSWPRFAIAEPSGIGLTNGSDVGPTPVLSGQALTYGYRCALRWIGFCLVCFTLLGSRLKPVLQHGPAGHRSPQQRAIVAKTPKLRLGRLLLYGGSEGSIRQLFPRFPRFHRGEDKWAEFLLTSPRDRHRHPLRCVFRYSGYSGDTNRY